MMGIDSDPNLYMNMIEDFMNSIDLAIEFGDVDKLKTSINYYKNFIPICYINIANNVYNELVLEKIEDLNINS